MIYNRESNSFYSIVRPGSAPPMKPHPPSGRTSTKKSYTHRSITPMSNTFPSTFIDVSKCF